MKNKSNKTTKLRANVALTAVIIASVALLTLGTGLVLSHISGLKSSIENRDAYYAIAYSDACYEDALIQLFRSLGETVAPYTVTFDDGTFCEITIIEQEPGIKEINIKTQTPREHIFDIEYIVDISAKPFQTLSRKEK